MHMFGFVFTIVHTVLDERIIVTIDCRLRFVCREVEVCIISSFCGCLCVSNPFFREEAVEFQGVIDTAAVIFLLFIYVCVVF